MEKILNRKKNAIIKAQGLYKDIRIVGLPNHYLQIISTRAREALA